MERKARNRAFRATDKYLEKSLAELELTISSFLFHSFSLSLSIFLSSVWHSEKTVTRDDPPKNSIFFSVFFFSICLFVCLCVYVCVCSSESLDYLDAKGHAFDAAKANDKKETKKLTKGTRNAW